MPITKQLNNRWAWCLAERSHLAWFCPAKWTRWVDVSSERHIREAHQSFVGSPYGPPAGGLSGKAAIGDRAPSGPSETLRAHREYGEPRSGSHDRPLRGREYPTGKARCAFAIAPLALRRRTTLRVCAAIVAPPRRPRRGRKPQSRRRARRASLGAACGSQWRCRYLMRNALRRVQNNPINYL